MAFCIPRPLGIQKAMGLPTKTPCKHSAQLRNNVELSKVRFFRSCLWSTYLALKTVKIMEEGFVTVNQVPTRVITLGVWINQPIKGNKLLLMIPGNFI